MTAARWIAALICNLGLLVALAAAPQRAHAAEGLKAPERVKVTAPFIELHTGPGRGYPVFFVVERHQWIAIELRRTDWYKVRAEGGQQGWVQRKQLESTLTEAGGTKSFRDILIDDYLSRRLELGAAWGRFRSDPMLKLWLGYKLAEPLAIELNLGQVQGAFSGTDFWSLGLVAEPWADRRLSPYLTVGIGQFKNFPNNTLVSAAFTDARLAHAGIGVRWYIAERFVARADWTLYTAFVGDARSIEYRAVTAGIAFFF
jgi:hypothetical protein